MSLTNPILVYVVTAEYPGDKRDSMGKRPRHDLAKFFSRKAAEEYASKPHHLWTAIAVEERAESEDAQHPAHAGAWRTEPAARGVGPGRR